MRRRDPSVGALIGGTVLLVIGVAFLLRNAGILEVDWDLLWPLILVALGVVIVVGAMRARGGTRGTGESDVVVPVEGARRLDLDLRLGAGRYALAGGSTALVEAHDRDSTIDARVDRSGDAARVRLATAVDSWAWGGRWEGLEWRIGVGPVPVALNVQAGAGRFDIDLRSVAVTSASFGIGAAELRVVLPRPTGDVPVRVEGGAASFVFEVPAGVEARVSSTGLLSTSGPTETPGYVTARDRVTVTVTGGAASVRVANVA